MAVTVVFFNGEGRITPHRRVNPRSRPIHFRGRKVARLVPVLRAALRLQAWMGCAVLAVAASDAFAAEGAPSEPSEALSFAQIGLLLVVGRLLGKVMQRIGQPAVMGQLVAGVLLGPSVLARFGQTIFPKNACGVAARHSYASAADRYGG
jgi:hypothetical protein